MLIITDLSGIPGVFVSVSPLLDMMAMAAMTPVTLTRKNRSILTSMEIFLMQGSQSFFLPKDYSSDIIVDSSIFFYQNKDLKYQYLFLDSYVQAVGNL